MSETHLKDGDYVLDDGAAWFTVKNFSVRIQKTDEGVVVDIFELGREDELCIAGTYAFDDEARQETEVSSEDHA